MDATRKDSASNAAEREALRREAVERLTLSQGGTTSGGLEAILARISAEVSRDAQERLDREKISPPSKIEPT